MTRFVEIINPAKVRSNTNLVVAGIKANQAEWSKFSFYPNKGVVGQVMGEAQGYEGLIYIVQCDENIIVPVLPAGISDISYDEFRRRLPQNKTVGKASQNQGSGLNADEFMDSLGKMFGW